MSRLLSVFPRAMLLLCVCAFMVGVGWSQDSSSATDDANKSEIAKRIDASAKVLDEIMATPDKAIPDKVMSKAKCLAVIPSTVRIAIGFGGTHGKGIATCRTTSGWSAPAPITLTGGSWGLQLGGEAVDLVLVVMNQSGMDHLLNSKFKIGASASGAAGPVGREAGADTDIKMRSEVLTYSRARGLFAGVDLSGSVVTQDKDETRVLYGKFYPFADILEGKVEPTASSRVFLAAVRKYSEQSHQSSKSESASGTELAAR
jgi:lipid-binding SYLF domain-containing protein